MKKLLAMLLSLAMVLSLAPAIAFADGETETATATETVTTTATERAAKFNDSNTSWAQDHIERWADYDVLHGKEDGNFDPRAYLTVGEAAQVFCNLLGLNKKADISEFTDLTRDWYKDPISKCVAAGILQGKGDGIMDPDSNITRERFFSMYARAVSIANGDTAAQALTSLANTFDDASKVSAWAADSVNTLVTKGYVNGLSDTELAPKSYIDRASLTALLDNSISTYVPVGSDITTVEAKSEGITLIAGENVSLVTGTADVVVVAAGAEHQNETTGEFEHSDIRVESAKMPIARVQGENITVTLAVESSADDAAVTETGVNSEIVVESGSKAGNITIAAEGAKATVKSGATVGNVVVEASNAVTTVAGKVDKVEVAETASNAEVKTQSGASVGEVTNAAEGTKVTGNGTVKQVSSSENVTVETKNTSVSNTNESKEIAVTDSKGTETKVESTASGTEGSGTSTNTNKSTTVNQQDTSSGGGYVAPATPAHTHSYGAWYYVDENTHAHKCSCGDIATVAHEFNNTSICAICGYDKDAVAMIASTSGDKYYKTLEDAVAGAESGETIKLLKPIAKDTSTEIEITQNIGLDLNGKALTNYQIVIKADVILKNGSIVNSSYTPITLYGAKLTLDGVSIVTSSADAFVVTNESEAATVSSIIVADGSVNSITTIGSGCDGIFAYALSNITLAITGESGKTGKLTIAGVNSSFHEYGASGNIYATISGLEIEFTNKVDTGYGNTLAISDVNGTFATDISDYCAAGYYAKLNSDTSKYIYTAINEEDADCRIIHSGDTYTYCLSLANAMMNVTDGETIQLLKDISIDSTSEGLSSSNVIFDLNNKTITSNGTWWIGRHNGNSNSPVTATIKNGNYVMGGKHSYGSGSGCIRFENASAGYFENVVFSTEDGNWSKLLQVYGQNKTGADEINTYSFKNCTFKNCYTSFEGSSSSSNNYSVNFDGCTFTAVNMSNGTSCILMDDYNYGTMTVKNTSFNINNTNNGGYAVNVDTYLDYTNGQKFNLNLDSVTMETAGNAQPYAYRFLSYNSTYLDNAVVTTTGTNVFKHNDVAVELAIREQTATNKAVVWVENAEAFQACYAEWAAYVAAKPASYNSSNYYLTENNGYYFVMGTGNQYCSSAVITKNDQGKVTKVQPNSWYIYNTIGGSDISTELGTADNANVKIYTLSNNK